MIARTLLARVRLDHFLDGHGMPTEECWQRIEAGTMSSGERVMVSVALSVIDYGQGGGEVPRISELTRLDCGNLRAVGEALIALAGGR